MTLLKLEILYLSSFDVYFYWSPGREDDGRIDDKSHPSVFVQ